mmetsp:Transcript_31445/g.52035  ORF Transcript_31445/g.52035 Transcript_31445/m.52035 type:complete len:232 (-) Transcript_31445:721-1416(-)
MGQAVNTMYVRCCTHDVQLAACLGRNTTPSQALLSVGSPPSSDVRRGHAHTRRMGLPFARAHGTLFPEAACTPHSAGQAARVGTRLCLPPYTEGHHTRPSTAEGASRLLHSGRTKHSVPPVVTTRLSTVRLRSVGCCRAQGTMVQSSQWYPCPPSREWRQAAHASICPTDANNAAPRQRSGPEYPSRNYQAWLCHTSSRAQTAALRYGATQSARPCKLRRSLQWRGNMSRQ